jgi:acetylornithine deacetylase
MKGSKFLFHALVSANCVSAIQIPILQHLLPALAPQQEVSDPTPAFTSTSTSLKPLLHLHRSLCEISSITGNEHNVTSWLASYLKDHGLTVELQVVDNPEYQNYQSRHNILAYPGKKRQTRTLVSSHLDVVPPYWPYELRNNDTEIWGRGVVDAKGSTAAQIAAFAELFHAGEIKDGDVSLLFVVGEEKSGDGMRKANDLDLSWETVIFGEPTELKLASGHKGIASIKLTAKGRAGHSGYPELGRSANEMLVRVLGEVLKTEWPSSEKYGNTTVNIGRIEGGVAANVIAEDAFAEIAIRIADGGPEAIQELIQKAIKASGQDVEALFRGGYGPVPIDHDVKGKSTTPLHLDLS